MQYVHTFIRRPAPERSQYVGEVCCELKCPPGHSVQQPLKELGIEFQYLEHSQNPYTGWKLVRFHCKFEDMVRLYYRCEKPDQPWLRDETVRQLNILHHIRQVNREIAIEHAEELLAA